MHKQTIVKDWGYGPYFLILRWHPKERPHDQPMYAVFSTYKDLNTFREKISDSAIVNGWELGVDHTRRE